MGSFEIGSDRLRAEVHTTGAALAQLHVAVGDEEVPVVAPGPPFLGVIVGRYANRIGDARFTLDGVEHLLDPNEGPNTLHGGRDRWSTREWEPVAHDQDHVVLRLVSPDGDQRFPGEVTTLVTYRVEGDELRMSAESTTNAATVISLTNHAYWDLSGRGDVLGHHLEVGGTEMLAVDDGLVPTGARLPFPSPVPLDEGSIDRCVVLDEAAARAARLTHGPLVMDVTTGSPGLQVFVTERGICLEAQSFPDSPNRSTFPSTVLRPGATARWWATHSFTVTEP